MALTELTMCLVRVQVLKYDYLDVKFSLMQLRQSLILLLLS